MQNICDSVEQIILYQSDILTFIFDHRLQVTTSLSRQVSAGEGMEVETVSTLSDGHSFLRRH